MFFASALTANDILEMKIDLWKFVSLMRSV